MSHDLYVLLIMITKYEILKTLYEYNSVFIDQYIFFLNYRIKMTFFQL